MEQAMSKIAVKRKAAKKGVKTVTRRIVKKKTAHKAADKVQAKSVKGYSQKDLEHFRNIILEKRKEILDELQILKENMMDVTTGEYVTENSTYSMHMEQGTDAMEREKTFLFASREGKFLNYLEDALKRIEKGSYGFCTDCGKLIERERLEAVPHAQLCIRCKVKRGGR
ncbi:MAG: TraR/DksA C4-type zinc finger protein [Bacteroidota bacterium]|nr:TraR/DksA C4-type zinc finger protein [Bacteroidota bacterium]